MSLRMSLVPASNKTTIRYCRSLLFFLLLSAYSSSFSTRYCTAASSTTFIVPRLRPHSSSSSPSSAPRTTTTTTTTARTKNSYYLIPKQSPSSSFALLLLTMTTSSTTTTTTTPRPSPSSRLVYGKDDALFGYIERQQQQHAGADDSSTSFGFFGQRVLDAGTGLHSLRWLASLAIASQIEEVVAVTADQTMQTKCQHEWKYLVGDDNDNDNAHILYGNWFPDSNNDNDDKSSKPPKSIEEQIQIIYGKPDDGPVHGLFDVIIADYLIGAMDGFSPYQQDVMIEKLCNLLKPNGMLYIVGLEPIPNNTSSPDNDNIGQNIICQVRRVRDACILLAGHRCYREYPKTWIIRQLLRQPKIMSLMAEKEFPILYRHETIVKQINVGRSKLKLISEKNPELAQAMDGTLHELEQQSLSYTSQHGKIQLGFDYVIVATKKKKKTEAVVEEASLS